VANQEAPAPVFLRKLDCIVLSSQIIFREELDRRGKRRDALPPRMARLSESFSSELCKIRCLEFTARSRRRYGKSVPYGTRSIPATSRSMRIQDRWRQAPCPNKSGEHASSGASLLAARDEPHLIDDREACGKVRNRASGIREDVVHVWRACESIRLVNLNNWEITHLIHNNISLARVPALDSSQGSFRVSASGSRSLSPTI
jgi:hypothetical protein